MAGVQRVQERERLVVLRRQGAHRVAVFRVDRRLSPGQHGRDRLVRAGEYEVQRQMVAAELDHPGRGGARNAEYGQDVGIPPRRERLAGVG